MAAVDTTGAVTMLELVKRTNPDGTLAHIVDTLSEKNAFLKHAKWKEANGKDSHMFVQSLSEPSGTWGRANKGISIESNRTKQITEPIKILESYADIDTRILARERDKAGFRYSVDISTKAGLTKTLADAFIYGTEGDDVDMLNGLAYREDYDAASDTQVIDAGGSGSDTMSVWLAKWDDQDGVYFTYPEGDPDTMFEQKHMGEQPVYEATGANGAVYYVDRTYHKMNVGLNIADPRAVVRIASIETSGTSNILTSDLILEAMTLLPSPDELENAVLYMNRTGWLQLTQEAKDKTNVLYQPDAPFGKWVYSFDGVNVVLMDALKKTETAL